MKKYNINIKFISEDVILYTAERQEFLDGLIMSLEKQEIFRSQGPEKGVAINTSKIEFIEYREVECQNLNT